MLFLTLGIFPLTDTGSTNYRYYQYQLPVLAVPITGTGSTNYRYWQYRLPVPAVPISGIFLILRLRIFFLTLAVGSRRLAFLLQRLPSAKRALLVVKRRKPFPLSENGSLYLGLNFPRLTLISID